MPSPYGPYTLRKSTKLVTRICSLEVVATTPHQTVAVGVFKVHKNPLKQVGAALAQHNSPR